MAKGKRVKADTDVLLPIKDWDDADDKIRRVGDLQRRIEQVEAEATNEVNKINNRCKDKVERLKAKQTLHTKSLQAFAEDHRADFKNAKSKSLVFGKVGWRKNTTLKVVADTLQLIKERFSVSFSKQLINVKETVNKTALKKLKDKDLKKVGARVEEKDVFYIEPLIVNVKDDDDDARIKPQVGNQQ